MFGGLIVIVWKLFTAVFKRLLFTAMAATTALFSYLLRLRGRFGNSYVR